MAGRSRLMKSRYEATMTRAYPHLVTRGARGPVRWSLRIANAPVRSIDPEGPLTFIGAGMLDRRGDLTPHGRDVVSTRIRAEALAAGRERCVVWASEACTWFGPDGVELAGVNPPEATVTYNAHLYATLDLACEECTAFEMPSASMHSHLCVMRIGPRHIEIAPGERIALGVFDDPVPPRQRDPAAGLLDGEGRLAPPERWRGQPVHGVESDVMIVGPVQPCADGIILRDPWPFEVCEAAERIAGCALDSAMVAEIRRLAGHRGSGFAPSPCAAASGG